MSGGNTIRVVGPEQPEQSASGVSDQAGSGVAEDFSSDDDANAWEEPEPGQHRTYGWLFPALALVAIAGWTGFFVWAHRGTDPGKITPLTAIDLLTQWSIPTLMVLAVWLLAARNSRKEAARFGEIARDLRLESEGLELKLAVINRELSLAREFLGAQSRELESLGRVAVDRLSTHAGMLQSLVQSNGDQVEAIASVSATALENMGRLRDDLPVIANSARDAANQIGGAGRTAHNQIDELVAGFERLNQFGQASERQVGSLQSRVDAAIASFAAQLTQMEDLTGARFDALRSASEAFRSELDGREVEALAAMRRRGEALEQEISVTRSALEDIEGEALQSLRARLGGLQDEFRQVAQAVRDGEQQAAANWSAQIEALQQRLLEAIEEIRSIDEAALASANRKLEALRKEAEAVDNNIAERDARLFTTIAKRQSELARVEREALDGMEQRLQAIDTQLAERRAALAIENEALESRGQAVVDRLQELREQLAAVAAAGDATEVKLAAGISALAEKLVESRDALAGTDAQVIELTEASVRLLELIQAAAEHSRTELPAALTEAETRLTDLRQQAGEIRTSLGEAVGHGSDLSAYVIATRDDTANAMEQVLGLQGTLSKGTTSELDRIARLRAEIEASSAEADALAARANGALRDAITLLEQHAKNAVESIEHTSAASVRDLAEAIAARSQAAISRSLAEGAEGALAELEQAAARASAVGRDATVSLRDQLSKVNELASNLETRVARARELAEEQVDRDFARRVALISEGLNSTAIDISKVLATDVSDTAWTAYLRGDRGIFTRRAVRLLDNTEAREIAELYDADPDFRENVSRYIADFENMLRTLLSTRDGKAVSVTLLSSDMGKLYVALAQAIERLRT